MLGDWRLGNLDPAVWHFTHDMSQGIQCMTSGNHREITLQSHSLSQEMGTDAHELLVLLHFSMLLSCVLCMVMQTEIIWLQSDSCRFILCAGTRKAVQRSP